MKGKILKQTVTATVLASSMLTFSPVTYGKTTSIQQSIDAIKMEMKNATLNYVEPAVKGEIIPSSTLYPVLNKVKKNVQKVRSEILSSNLSETEKIAKLKELDVLYEEKITKGLIPYIDAYNYAVKYLDPLLNEIIEGEANNDFAAVEKAYHKLSVQLKSRTSILYRFTGKAPRDLLLERYKLRADEERNKLMIPVTIYMKMEEAEKLFNEGKQEEAKKAMEGISSLIAKLQREAVTSFTNELIKQAEAIQSSVAFPPTTPTPDLPVIVPPSGGSNNENNTSPSESAVNRALRLAKANAIAELEAYGTQAEFSEVDWSNILLLKQTGKQAINKSTSTTAVEQALLATKKTIDQVKVKAATTIALNGVILAAEQLLANHDEGANVGQASLADRTALAQAIAAAKAIYVDAANKTQVDLENASTTLTIAITTFEAQVVQAGDATVLNGLITTAEQLLVNHAEGINVGEVSTTAREALTQAITTARAVHADASNQTQANLDNASTNLTSAITTFQAQVIKAGNPTVLTGAITVAEQLLVTHTEGTNVGQVSVVARETLAQAITAAKIVHSDAGNQTQRILDDASTTLTAAITTFEAQVVRAGDATALIGIITTADQLLITHAEGTNVGQASAEARETLTQAISVAKVVHSDAGNQTQRIIDDASTTLTAAITTFEAQVVKAGDTTTLSAAISSTTTLYTNAIEGTEVNHYIIGSKTILQTAINAAQFVLDNAANKTTQQLADAKALLDQAIAEFENSKVVALPGLIDLTITGTATNSSNVVALNDDETLVLTSSDATGSVAAAIEDPSGTIKVTGVAAGDPVIITVQVVKDGRVIKSGSFTVKIISEFILSKTVTNLDFSTTYGTQATLVSRSVPKSDFTGDRKDFSIVVGGDEIPIYVDWKLSTDFPKGAAMGSVVESFIQDFYFKKSGAAGILNRPIGAFGVSDTFQISAFQPGAASSFTLIGKDWSYFFDQSVAQGTDTNTSKNRTFTISDGTNTATIQLTTSFTSFDELLNMINNRITSASVQAVVEGVSGTQFKITPTTTKVITVGGINKSDFFE